MPGKMKNRITERSRRLRIATWFSQDNARLCRAVNPALNLHFYKIPKARLESVRVEKQDVLQIAALNLLSHPTFVRRLVTFDETCRLYARFIKYYCQRVAKQQQVRNRLGNDIERTEGFE